MTEAETSAEYRCLLCLNEYIQPRELSCHHTFCSTCLAEYINKQHVTTDEDRQYFPCPVCETPITPRDPSQPVSTWASSFPTNQFFVGSIVVTFDGKICDACLRENESNKAEVWCSDCPDYLCKQCRIAHTRNRISATHTLVSTENAENVHGIREVSVNDVCPNHEEKTLDVYCLDHNALCCSVCVCLQHRNCRNMKSLKDMATETMTEKQRHGGQLEKIAEIVRKMLDENEMEMGNLSARQKKISDEMTHLVQLVKDKLDDLNEIFQSDLRHKCNVCKNQLSVRQRHIKAFQANADNSKALMSQLEKHPDHHKTFIVKEQTKQQLLTHYRRLDQNTKKQTNTFDITLTKAAIIDEIMKMISVGNVDIISKLTVASQDATECINIMLKTLLTTPTSFADSVFSSDLCGPIQHLPVQPTQGQILDVWKEPVSLLHTVKSETLGLEASTCLTGGIYTDNGELIVTDFYNKRLLLLDDTYSYLDEYPVEGNPSDIARGQTDGDIFVAVVSNQIIRCTLGIGQLSVVNVINTPIQTWGITVYGENVLCGTDRSVDVLSMDGEVMRSFKKRGTFTYLAMSRNAVYHKDNDDIVCTGLDDGKEISRYRDPCLREPRGIGVDRDGNVYVGGLDSGNVYLLSPDMSQGREILPKLSVITKAYSIMVHPTKQEFGVTSLRESTSLEVYRFNDNIG